MAFSNKIKEVALVASARRCCVCKEFVGRNIEVEMKVGGCDFTRDMKYQINDLRDKILEVEDLWYDNKLDE